MRARIVSSWRQALIRHRLEYLLLAVASLGLIAIYVIYSVPLNYPPIRSDGLGYYLYLPATFIYRDLSLQRLAVVFNNGTVPNATPEIWKNSGPHLWEQSGNYLIKYPLGEALMLMPCFFIACLVALITSTPIDGFSAIFQYSAALSGLIYAIAGIAILWKVLQAHFRPSTILLVVFGLIFGTDLFHYATYDSVFSHVYSFFLFSAFLFVVQHIYLRGSTRSFLAGGALCGLIVLTRPTNAIWLLFGIFYDLHSRASLQARFAFWKAHRLKLAYGGLLCASLVSLQMFYWQMVSGTFIVFSYRNEHFNFLRPEVFNVLFSVRKGLFFWSPILLTVIPGLCVVRKRSREFATPIFLFLPLNLFIISSWGSWYYGGSFGHRAFVESIPLFAICFCCFYEAISSICLRRCVVVVTLLCATLSTWLMLKYWTGVLPCDGTTWSRFVETFFVLLPR